jgi:hypothetical protein
MKRFSIFLVAVALIAGMVGCGGDGGVEYDLTINSTAGGAVTNPGEGTFTYDAGTVVGLVVEAEEVYHFDRWAGNVDTIADVDDPTTSITINGDYFIIAKFAVDPQYILIITSTEGGEVTDPGEGVFSYDEGTVVNLVATPDPSYHFVNWTGNVSTIADVEDATTTITMNGDYFIIANFALGNVTGSTQNAGGLVEGNSDTVSNIMVVANPSVACACANYTVTFTTTLALAEFQKIYIRFPAGSDLSGICGTKNITLWWYDPVVTMDWVPMGINSTCVFKYADGTSELHITLGSGVNLPAGSVKVIIQNLVANPPVAGTYELEVSTEREPT